MSFISQTVPPDSTRSSPKHQRERRSKPVYTVDPLPRELLFDGYERYIVPIPSIGYEDRRHATAQLTTHFEKMHATITESIRKLERLRRESEEGIAKWQRWLAENGSPSKVTLNHINQRFWRLRVFLRPKEVRTSIKLNTLLNEKYSLAITVLSKLQLIAEELAARPRYVGFVTKSISDLIKITCYRYQHHLKSLRFFLSDVSAAMHLLPHYFSDAEAARAAAVRLIEGMQRSFDTETYHLLETEDYYTFVDYIRSKNSPLRAAKALAGAGLRERVAKSAALVQTATGIEDPAAAFVIGCACMRYWAERSACFEEYYRSACPGLSRVLAAHRSDGWDALRAPSAASPLLSGARTVGELFSGAPVLADASATLFGCIFEVNPCDVARAIMDIDGSLLRFSASRLGADPRHRSARTCADFLWKLLFIHANVPGIDCALAFAADFADCSYAPPRFAECVNAPLRVMARFIAEAEALPKE